MQIHTEVHTFTSKATSNVGLSFGTKNHKDKHGDGAVSVELWKSSLDAIGDNLGKGQDVIYIKQIPSPDAIRESACAGDKTTSSLSPST